MVLVVDELQTTYQIFRQSATKKILDILTALLHFLLIFDGIYGSIYKKVETFSMAYRNFTLESVRTTFGLETVESADTFSEIEPVAPSDHLMTALSRNAPLAVAIGTEKAKSEGNNIHCVYGVTTSGTDWLFLKLEGQKLHIDMGVYAIGQYDKILGILSSMVSQKA